ncbi:integrase catalytic domain-containing protein [Trichonephila clavipes]|uniref:Integrase catalytic domain-containing protein n=1 Tax=Trichonephila clavipes TaxID=2585209 RepID=A0A8X6S804_TRICX|nr:integrase catalytic domain-containing protein [Trichonephila clavipes]
MMYRTILINPKQRNLERIVWCESEHESPKIYELSTVTYGTVSAPYLAQSTLTQLSMDEEANFPIAASVLRNNLYMDDVLCGAATLEGAIVLRQQLKGILKSAGMELHKLCANHEKLSPDPEQNYNFATLTETKTFVENLKGINKVAGPLTTKEFEKAETFLVKKVQEQEFSSGIDHLKSKGSVLPNSKLKTLNPFLDDNGVLRRYNIELVSDLTSQAFIAALKRLMARRGKCAKLFSDNGKNFVGASNEIKKLLEIVRKPDEKLANYLAAEGIEWKCIPARSPNFGGLWEAAIKSFITIWEEEEDSGTSIAEESI